MNQPPNAPPPAQPPGYGQPSAPEYGQPPAGAPAQQALVPATPGGLSATGTDVYVARRNFFNFWGIRFRVLTLDGQLMHFVYQKAFKLKEDITVYADTAKQVPQLHIQARQIIDFSAAYDVVDVASGQKIGALRRKGWESMARDEWTVLNVYDQPIATIQEDSLAMALLRRLLSNLIPQNYTVYQGQQAIGQIHGTWNPFIVKYTVDFSGDPNRYLDRRLALAGVVLLMCIEGKQG